MRVRYNLFDYVNILLLFLFALVTLYPFYYILSRSLSDGMGIASGAAATFPSGFNTEAYKMVFRDKTLLRAYYNSIKYSLLGTVVFIYATSIVAYPLTVKGFWLNKPASVYYVLTMFLSGGLIPTYLLYRALGLINNTLVMVLPGALAVFSIIVFRTYFQSLGTELREAAYVDGANDIYVLLRIFMPLSKPIIATFSLFQMVGIWNNFFTPFIYLTDEKLHPLTVLLRRLVVQLDTINLETARQLEELLSGLETLPVPIEAFRAAAIIVSTLPIICIYPFIQRYFVKGIMIGSLKA